MAFFNGTIGADTIIPGFVSFGVSGTGTPGDDSDTILGNVGEDLLDGGGGNDSLNGGLGTNTLIGGAGDDTLNPGDPTDRLEGGSGNDLYLLGAAAQVVVELADDGIDTGLFNYENGVLPDNVEIGQLQFTVVTLSGNALDNWLIGNGVNNLLNGAGGHDSLTGLEGADTLSGDAGADTLDGGNGADRLSGGADNDVYLADSTDTLLDSGGVDTVRIASSHTLGAAFENLVLLGSAALTGTGNTSANLMVANDGGNTLNGDTGADTLLGGTGHDSLAGNAGDDRLEGGAGADSLNGLADNDTMIGGAGDDVFFVGQFADAVIEEAGGGTDTVQVTAAFTGSYVLPDHVEHLILAGNVALRGGTGNALDNAITGDAGINQLSGLHGADTLDGGGGPDTLFGGTGNDVYVVNDLSDAVSEAGGDGVDLVLSGVSFTLGAGLENLTLTGGGGVSGTGNALANMILGNEGSNELAGGGAADTLVGQGGNDLLNGGADADSMAGGGNSDRYTVDNSGDVVVEEAVAGTDVVSAFVNWTLSENVEQLNLLGAALQGFGNGLANRIAGNANDNLLIGFTGNDVLLGGDGADTLVGGPGQDAMTGGAGADRFLFNSTSDGVDRIADFAPGVDVLAMAAVNFGGLPAGALAAANFVAHAANTATSAAGVPQFIYNTAAGALFFDADGLGGAAQARLAVLTGAPALTAADILLV